MTTGYDAAPAEIGVIGGSGLYALLGSAQIVNVETPWGSPSDPITIGQVDGRRVAFLPRHGRDHRFPHTASTTGPTSGPCAASVSGRLLRRAPSVRSGTTPAPAPS